MKKILLVLLGVSHIVFAQQSSITGKVTDAANNPVPFVSVQLLEISKGASSDENGLFQLEHLAEGKYTLKASFVGYKSLEQVVNLTPNSTLNLELVLLENNELLKEIVVKGTLSINQKVQSIGKSDIRAMDLPQAVYTIDRTTLENQQVNSLQDVLMNTNGVYVMGATGGYQEEIAARGFSFGSNNTFKNGVRYINSMMPEVSGLEKVEVLKGSAALLYGNVSAGGILNLVTKKPKFDFGGEVNLRYGSFDLIKPSFDVYGGLGKGQKVAFRLNGTYQKANSFRQYVNSERFYINPSLLFNVTNKTDLLLEGDYLNDHRVPDFGTGVVAYEVLTDYPRDRFLGVKWGYMDSKQSSATATLNHRFNESWRLTATGSYRNAEQQLFTNRRPNTGGLIGVDGLWVRGLQKNENYNDYYVIQADLNGTFRTGNIKHQVLLGADSDHFTEEQQAYASFNNYDTLNVFQDLPANVRNDIPELAQGDFTSNPTHRYGVYVQDLISLTEKLKVLGGVRYSTQQTSNNITNVEGLLTTTENPSVSAFSPRGGVVYQPSANHSLFASYANSFAPNSGVDIEGNALPPSIQNQYEAGIKNEIVNGKVSLNAVVYQIDDNNRAQQSLANGNTNRNVKELTGYVRSRGAELDMTASPVKNLSLLIGYSYNKSIVVSSTTITEGSVLRYNPNHTANASINYGFSEGALKGLRVGLTSAYIGVRYAGRDTPKTNNTDGRKPVPLPAYYQIDATASYTWKNVSLRAKVANLLNELSYNVHDDNSVNPVAPRNGALTLAYRF